MGARLIVADRRRKTIGANNGKPVASIDHLSAQICCSYFHSSVKSSCNAGQKNEIPPRKRQLNRVWPKPPLGMIGPDPEMSATDSGGEMA